MRGTFREVSGTVILVGESFAVESESNAAEYDNYCRSSIKENECVQARFGGDRGGKLEREDSNAGWTGLI
jgi:hypothetical protein